MHPLSRVSGRNRRKDFRRTAAWGPRGWDRCCGRGTDRGSGWALGIVKPSGTLSHDPAPDEALKSAEILLIFGAAELTASPTACAQPVLPMR